MANTNGGGPAFPQSVSGHDGPTASYDFVDGSGMSLRDYFAAQVLPRLVNDLSTTVEENARDAYGYADAMLEARTR